MRSWSPLLIALLCFIATPTRGADRPNIVVILADDLGYGDPACYGGKILTPNIDRLAREGMRFTDAHSGSGVCSPTRYGLMTGRYAWRSRLQRGVLGGLSPRLIEPGRTTVASFLKQHGYHTACVGKWHLGMDWVLKPGQQVTPLNIEPREQVHNVEYTQPIQNGPTAVGFDEYFGISASLDMVPYAFIRNDRLTADPTDDRNFLMMHGREKGGSTRLGPTAPGFEADQVLPELTKEACAIIHRQAEPSQAGKPFFLYVPLAAPHTPILPLPEWQGKSGLNPYADFVMQTDAAVGQILQTLDEKKLTDNTLIILTSDNGCSPQAKFEELEAKGHHPSGPLRGTKADLFEGGHRVPFIVRWPGKCDTAATSPQLICLSDLMATVADLLGQPLPASAGEDSFSFLPALKTGVAAARDQLVSHSVNGSFAVRKGPWKLLLVPDSGGWSAPRPGTIKDKNVLPIQLYNLEDDLGEKTNLAKQQPQKVSELLNLMRQFVENGRSTSGEKQTNTVPVEITYPNLKPLEDGPTTK
jgi:arylsulfatase A